MLILAVITMKNEINKTSKDKSTILGNDNLLVGSYFVNNFILFGLYNFFNPIINNFHGVFFLFGASFAGFFICFVIINFFINILGISELKSKLFLIFQLSIIINFIGCIIIFTRYPLLSIS